MIFIWETFIKIIIFSISLGYMNQIEGNEKPSDWRSIEMLAEKHPYIVALLNSTKDYKCTGTIINKQTILTSGTCVNPEPSYIAVATAVIGYNVNNNNIIKVSHAELHGDYIFEMKGNNHNITKMHSNIALVFSVKPVMELYLIPAEIGNYYAPELRKKTLTAVGFGKISDSTMTALQKQAYHQMPCPNPKWYYCVCGVEHYALARTYAHEFGEGAPVLLGTEVVGISASPCGVLSIKNLGINYNIFTIIAPYMQWIQKTGTKSHTPKINFLSRNNDDKVKSNISVICIFLVFSKVFN